MNKFLVCTIVLAALFATMTPVTGLKSLTFALGVNASTLQGHIDGFASQASSWLRDTSNQEQIGFLLNRARLFASVIDLNATREACLEIIDHFHENLNNLSRAVNSSLTAIIAVRPQGDDEGWSTYDQRRGREMREALRPLKSAINDLRNWTRYGYERMFKEKLQDKLTNMSAADKETLMGIKRFLGISLSSAWGYSRNLTKKIEHGARLVEIIDYLANEYHNPDAYSRNRTAIAEGLLEDLRNFNISEHISFGKNAANIIFDNLEKLRSQLINTADEALVVYNNYAQDSSSISPGEFLDNQLQRLRQGLGEKVVNCRERILNQLHRIVQNTLQTLRFRNVPGFNDPDFNLKATMLLEKINQRFNLVYDSFRDFWYERRCDYWGYCYTDYYS